MQPLLLHLGSWAGGGVCRVSSWLLALSSCSSPGPHSCDLAFPGMVVVVVERILRGQRLMPFRAENPNILSKERLLLGLLGTEGLAVPGVRWV